MSRRFSGIDAVGLVFGLVVLASTVFAALSIFGAGPLAIAWPVRPERVVESITGELGRGISRGARAVQPPGVFGGAWRSEEGREEVSGPQTAVTVTNVSGPITVTGWDGDTVRVRWVKQARTDADLKDFVIEVRSDDRSVTVRPRYEQLGSVGRFGAVEFEISLPRRIASLTVRNTSGAIDVKDLPGAVAKDLSTVSGAITTSGDGELTAKSTSGAVRFDFAGDSLKLGTVSGRIEGAIRSLGPRGADIGTVSGSVAVDGPAGLSADLELRSVSGAVTCDYPVTIREQARSRLKGTIGSGGVPFAVSTTSGSIRIGRR